jgi:Peptidyl-tRNA hydrolase PTH2
VGEVAEQRPTKQVIVIRRDLRMRRDKEIVQGAHASLWWLAERVIQRMTVLTIDLERWLSGYSSAQAAGYLSRKPVSKHQHGSPSSPGLSTTGPNSTSTACGLRYRTTWL